MAAKNPLEGGTSLETKSNNQVNSAQSKGLSRRDFLKGAGLAGLGVASMYVVGCTQAPAAPTPTETPVNRKVFVPKATMMILGDPNLCVGCRRCEIACTTFNEGKVQPSLARIKIYRNYNFGPQGLQPGSLSSQGGIFGSHRIVQETCRQCPHPVPCLDACPAGAIEIAPETNARVVNTSKCTGCKTCQRACPWAMTTFDSNTGKASKCHLCGGNPECVKACPTGALQYVPWTDKTKDVPPRFIPAGVPLSADVQASCITCHPGNNSTTTK